MIGHIWDSALVNVPMIRREQLYKSFSKGNLTRCIRNKNFIKYCGKHDQIVKEYFCFALTICFAFKSVESTLSKNGLKHFFIYRHLHTYIFNQKQWKFTYLYWISRSSGIANLMKWKVSTAYSKNGNLKEADFCRLPARKKALF